MTSHPAVPNHGADMEYHGYIASLMFIGRQARYGEAFSHWRAQATIRTSRLNIECSAMVNHASKDALVAFYEANRDNQVHIYRFGESHLVFVTETGPDLPPFIADTFAPAGEATPAIPAFRIEEK